MGKRQKKRVQAIATDMEAALAEVEALGIDDPELEAQLAKARQAANDLLAALKVDEP